ncbi:MAG: hypothetical protein J3Q66DRAFT_403739 [Benniella sp.]|nr:MAG: hypothetical protein J3Q66DRAFT_403739 [Benniella sp.]
MTHRQSQFHHYIPRFILKTFADNFTLATNTEFIANNSTVFKATDPDVQARNNSHRRQPDYYINLYRAKDHSTVLSDIKRSYGLDDMYRDVTTDDCMKFEKLLAEMENASSTFIRSIWAGKDLELTRSQLSDMKKFLAIMMYRAEHRRSQYYDESFDMMTMLSIRKHMANKQIERVQDVWFDNLKWLIETPTKDIMEEYFKTTKTMDPMAILREYNGPIHVVELMDFAHMATNYVCIWEAEEGSEFILSEGCFGAFEGHMGICFHNFFVVSPRYAIVLVNRQYMRGTMGMMGLRKSFFGEELHANPETVYKNGPLPANFTEDDFSQDDVFKYRRIIVPKKDVYKVNGIFLDARTKYLTYKSSVCMYKSLRYYDKVKETMFHTHYDYSILKQKLFADMNRTHAS